MLQISVSKVAQIILLAHEMERAQPEFDAFVEALDEDEQASLVALMWIGRETFEPGEIDEAMATAREEATTPTVDYLKGTPHMADHLESALNLLDIDIAEAESDILHGN